MDKRIYLCLAHMSGKEMRSHTEKPLIPTGLFPSALM